ncbi:MAG: zinc ABC transporter substrate-binding protein [Anaerolineae bacterium]|nr:zinc ABC transporter substrate-binding protein [Anaerolineae bacterium]
MGVFAGCGDGAPPGGDGSETIAATVSIVPQQYFVERIGGEHVSVDVMVLPGASPATYEPRPEQLKALSTSAAYFSIGVPFEGVWLDRIAAANPEMVLVDTIAGIERVPMAAHEHGDEVGDEDHDHEAGAPDPHVWVSPALVKIQAQTIADALIALDPKNAADYAENLEGFLADIDALEADLQATLTGVTDRKFLVFHPSWGYFAEDFGLEQIAIEVGGQEPSAQELAALIALAKDENIKVVFAQAEFSTADAETIAAELGGEVLLISPLAYDWLANLREVATVFAEVLGR